MQMHIAMTPETVTALEINGSDSKYQTKKFKKRRLLDWDYPGYLK